jgi:fumarate reductase flavoprotein subunit
VSPKGKAANLEADVVVIGSGGGLAAAVAAAEAGASVILLEKENVLGGYTRQANALMACESPVQKRLNVTITREEVFQKFMNWNHWHRVDARVVSAFINKSGDTIRWLEAKGVEFDLMTNDYGFAVIHMPKDMMASVQKALIESAKDLGMNMLLHTSGKRIMRGAKGNITGVLAQTRDGQEFEIKTKSAIIATGGFGDNRELLRKYCPDYYDGMRLDDWPRHEAHSGDGIFMAEAIGAAIADWVPIYHRGGSGGLGGPPWRPILPRSMPQRMVWVNKKGERFADEVSCGSMEGNMAGGNALFRQPNRIAYSLFGAELVETMEAGGPGVEEPPRKHAKRGGGAILVSEKITGLREKIQRLAGEGRLKMVGSWEEMAAWIGCDPAVLKAEIDAYNSYCDKGHDEMFAKDPAYLVPLRQPPYYGIKGSGGGVGETLGGIKVDEHMAVLDRQGSVIPGVYAAGVIADGHQGQTYCYELGGCAVGFAVNSGRIAGESAAKYILGKADNLI